MPFFSAFAAAVYAYAGLFFTIIALVAGAYLLASRLLVPDRGGTVGRGREEIDEASEDRPCEGVRVGDFTLEELRGYDGSDPGKPLLMAIKGQVYDVSKSRLLYGPGGPYELFAGRDATRAMALMSFDPDDLTGNTEGLSKAELEVLQDWESKFIDKYTTVGQLIDGRSKLCDGGKNQNSQTGISNKTEEMIHVS